MSLYTDAVSGGGGNSNRVSGDVNVRSTSPLVVVNEDSGLWKLVKYLGAGLVLWGAYDKLRELRERGRKAADPDTGNAESEREE